VRERHHAALPGHHWSHHLDRDCVLASGGRRTQGHSAIGFFILSLAFFPLALIMAYVVQDRSRLVAA
jgi:hypothetical protein